MLPYLVWDPDPDFFTVPYVGHSVKWYGVLFAAGFFCGYIILRRLLGFFLNSSLLPGEDKDRLISSIVDKLTLFIVLGTILGARLGHVLFYGLPHYRTHSWWDVLKIWEGGLASHGGAVGIVVGLLLFRLCCRKRFPALSFLTLLDLLVIPAAMAGGWIRIGNFINQEIVGTPTQLPWGVIFLHPAESGGGIPLHPAQLYESAYYFLTFGCLYWLWSRNKGCLGSGLIAGLFFLLVFGFRFLIEWIKMPQTEWSHEASWIFNMGQWLSLPFISAGMFLLTKFVLKRNQQRSHDTIA